MIYKEEVRDLFSVPDDYYLVHCISADFGMGKGIAVEFCNRFDTKNILRSKYPNYENTHKDIEHWPNLADCILEGRVLNLITKTKCYLKPTYDSLSCSLLRMRSICNSNGIKKVAMPVIGCGLERLQWDEVSKIIQTIFENMDIEILICKQE